MKMFKNASMLLAGLAALMLSVAAQASPIQLTRSGADGWTNGFETVYIPAVSPTHSGGSYGGGSVYAGEFKFTVSSGDDDFATGTTLGLFCIDLSRNLNNNSSYYVVSASDYLGNDKANLVAALYDAQYGNVTDAASSANFQKALWNIVEGTSLLTSFDDDLTPGASSLYNLFVFIPSDADGRIKGQVLIGVTPVPEPGTLALLGLGLLGAGAIRRRRS